MGFRSDKKQKVEVIAENDRTFFSTSLSNFLNTHKVADVQFSTAYVDGIFCYIALVIYEEE